MPQSIAAFLRRAAGSLRRRWHLRLLRGRLRRFRGRRRFAVEDVLHLHAVFGKRRRVRYDPLARQRRAEAFLRKVARFASPAGRAFLDVGTGYGDEPLAIARAGAAVSVGLDRRFPPGSAAEGSARPPALHFVRGDAHYLPFRDGTFDLVHTNSIEHFPDPASCVEEMLRVLRPGGLLLLFIGGFYPSPDGDHLYNVINVPWSHLLFDHETLFEAVRRRAPSRERAEADIRQFRELNGWSVDDYRRLLDSLSGRCELLHLEEHAYDLYAFNVMLEAFPHLLEGRTRRQLTTYGLDAVLRKR